MVEFLIILPVMLLLVMGTIQFAFIYQAKHTLNYATFHTARAGTINNLSMSAMEMAFASNMAPLYTHSYWVMGGLWVIRQTSAQVVSLKADVLPD